MGTGIGRRLKEKINVYTTEETLNRLRLAAALEGITMRQFVNEAVLYKINSLNYDLEKYDPKSTEKVMKSVEKIKAGKEKPHAVKISKPRKKKGTNGKADKDTGTV